MRSFSGLTAVFAIVCLILTTYQYAEAQILPVEISYDDGSAEGFLNLGSIRGCYYMVYFTVDQPEGKLLSVKVYLDSAEEFDIVLWSSEYVETFRYSIYTGEHFKPESSGWCEVNLQGYSLDAPMPGFYILIKPLKETPNGYRPMVGLDTSSPSKGRSYIYFCGNKSYTPVNGNIMIRAVVGYQRSYIPPTPPPVNATAHDIYGFILNKSMYSTIVYGSISDYASVMLLDSALKAEGSLQLYAIPKDRPLITVGGPVAVPGVAKLNDKVDVDFTVLEDAVVLRALGSEWTYKREYWGWRDYAVIYFTEEGDGYILSIQGCTRYGTKAASLMVALSGSLFQGITMAVIEWRDLNFDGQVQLSECLIVITD